MKAALIIILVIAVIIGGLLTLRSTRGAGMPSEDVIERAKSRERDQEDKDRRDSDP